MTTWKMKKEDSGWHKLTTESTGRGSDSETTSTFLLDHVLRKVQEETAFTVQVLVRVDIREFDFFLDPLLKVFTQTRAIRNFSCQNFRRHPFTWSLGKVRQSNGYLKSLSAMRFAGSACLRWAGNI